MTRNVVPHGVCAMTNLADPGKSAPTVKNVNKRQRDARVWGRNFDNLLTYNK